MLVKRKSDGKIIEVREWPGASDVVYSTLDMNEFYQESELNFNVDVEETVISGWVARDEDGHLFMYCTKPERNEVLQVWMGKYANFDLRDSLFPDLTWESEPKKVKITIEEI